MLEGLQAILEKDVVLPTVKAADLLHDPEAVEGNYERHVATFVSMGEVNDFRQRLVRDVTGQRTPKGMIIAPYGYGKTSTLAFLWHESEEKGLVATPPFYCATLLDILDATYGWVKYRLETSQPGLVPDLNAVYRKHTAVTVEQMAEQHASEHGIAQVTAVSLLTRLLDDGSLVLDLTPSNLLFFLDAATSIVEQAGFHGLVILADEFQQYLSTAIRKFIPGLRISL